MNKTYGIVNLQDHGLIKLIQYKDKMIIKFELKNFEPFSIHAIHIHEFGNTLDGCNSLGGHYNPTNQNHGSLNSTDRHLGDLFNNFNTNLNGEFNYTWITNDLNINDLFGRSFVIHKYPDDYGIQTVYETMKTNELKKKCMERNYNVKFLKKEMMKKLKIESKITGNAGSRMACGIIARTKPLLISYKMDI